MTEIDRTDWVKNWQFCDGSHFQDGIPELNVPDGWILRYVDRQPIPEADPPIIGYRPECLPVSIWDVGGEGGKFGQSPPNPGKYNAVFKVHKWSAPFAFELVQSITGFIPGKRYILRAWAFPDFYGDDGKPPKESAYAAAVGIGIDGEVVYHWPKQSEFDTWTELECEFTADAETIEVSIAGLAKWGLPGNSWWLHGLRLYEVGDPDPPTPGGTVELGPQSRAFIRGEVDRIIAALNPKPPEPPDPPSGYPVDVRGALVTNSASPWYPWKQRSLSDIDTVFVHHSAGAASSSLDTVKAIAQYHTSPTGKNRPGICYTYVIGADGTTWYVSDIENIVFSQGSAEHPGDENRWGVGVCLLGSFINGKQPTAAQLTALEALIAYLENALGKTLRVWGHKDVIGTQCPGDAWPFKPGWGKNPQPPSDVLFFGLHDERGSDNQLGSQWFSSEGPAHPLVVRPVYVGTQVQAVDYGWFTGARVIVSLRYSFAQDNGGAGTLPRHQDAEWAAFVRAAVDTIKNSRGVWGWEIGNEYNNPREFPATGPLTAQDVAQTYNAIRAGLRNAGVTARLCPGPLDPFNAQAGDPRAWLATVWAYADNAEFIGTHGYVRGPDPALVGSEARFQDDPLRWQYLNYPGCITELLKSLPVEYRDLPVYVTEFNHLWKTVEGDWGWVDDDRAAQVIRAAYTAAHAEGFAGLVLYRWAGDQWQFQHNEIVKRTLLELA